MHHVGCGCQAVAISDKADQRVQTSWDFVRLYSIFTPPRGISNPGQARATPQTLLDQVDASCVAFSCFVTVPQIICPNTLRKPSATPEISGIGTSIFCRLPKVSAASRNARSKIGRGAVP